MSESPIIKIPTGLEPQDEIQHPEIPVEKILDIVLKTEIDPAKLESYLDPEKTPSQSLDKTLESSMQSLLDRTKQRMANVPAYRFAPEAMDIWAEMARLGTACEYILRVSEGKNVGGTDTHPFTGTSWDIDTKRVEEISVAVKGQLETARALLDHQSPTLPKDEIEAMPLIMAISYLKVKPLIEVSTNPSV
jgi:hypothetical protein